MNSVDLECISKMESYTKKYLQEMKGKGEVSKITEYSFVFTSFPDKNGKTESHVVMLSWFFE